MPRGFVQPLANARSVSLTLVPGPEDGDERARVALELRRVERLALGTQARPSGPGRSSSRRRPSRPPPRRGGRSSPRRAAGPRARRRGRGRAARRSGAARRARGRRPDARGAATRGRRPPPRHRRRGGPSKPRRRRPRRRAASRDGSRRSSIASWTADPEPHGADVDLLFALDGREVLGGLGNAGAGVGDTALRGRALLAGAAERP